MSPSNTIVLRRSPDWTSFDLEGTRAFCANLGFPESIIIDFARLWDASMRLNYREYRQQIKNLALDNAAKCEDAHILNYDNYLKRDRNFDDWYYFTDDDDWISPTAFSALKSLPCETAIWGSIYIGRLYTDSETAKAADQVVTFRNIDPAIFYTNNYSLKGSILQRLGNGRLVEHYDAQTTYDEKNLSPHKIDLHLSAANKHPCCTMAIIYNMRSEKYRNHVRSALEEFTDDLEAAADDLDGVWAIRNIRQFIKLNRDALT
jgi:hypothetical protein